MMSGVPLETWWAFDKLWNNKFYYKVASCWLFLLICCGSFGLNFILLTRRHYSGSLLWDLGGTSLIITERSSGINKYSKNLVEFTAGAQKNRKLISVVRYFRINSVLVTRGQYSGSLLLDLGGTSLTITGRPSEAHKFSEKLVQATSKF
jgi:hypothetical protein